MKTHYDNLQVSRHASEKVIRAAYKSLSQVWHPDKNANNCAESDRIMKIINRAYEVLSDPELRAQHDEWIGSKEAFEGSNPESAYQQTTTGSAGVDDSVGDEFRKWYTKKTLETKTCPECAETIMLEAKVCRFCNHAFSIEDVEGEIHRRKKHAERNALKPRIYWLLGKSRTLYIISKVLRVVGILVISLFLLMIVIEALRGRDTFPGFLFGSSMFLLLAYFAAVLPSHTMSRRADKLRDEAMTLSQDEYTDIDEAESETISKYEDDTKRNRGEKYDYRKRHEAKTRLEISIKVVREQGILLSISSFLIIVASFRALPESTLLIIIAAIFLLYGIKLLKESYIATKILNEGHTN